MPGSSAPDTPAPPTSVVPVAPPTPAAPPKPPEVADQSTPQAVAEAIFEFFAVDDAGTGKRLHTGCSKPTNATKASSKLEQPVWLLMSSGEPSPTTRPWAMTTIRSHKAETSCMM